MRRPPTDYELLREIYQRYRDEFGSYEEAALSGRESKILVPVDLGRVARELGVDADSVFGRLYYHLDAKYGEPRPPGGGPRKVFFTPVAGDDRDCVNFPLLEAVLAGLWEQRRRDLWAVGISLASLAIALGSLLVSLLAA